jgi:hypothetical protein
MSYTCRVETRGLISTQTAQTSQDIVLMGKRLDVRDIRHPPLFKYFPIFWDVTQRRLLAVYRRLGSVNRRHLQRSSSTPEDGTAQLSQKSVITKRHFGSPSFIN